MLESTRGAVVLREEDDVAVALATIPAGTNVEAGGRRLEAMSNVPNATSSRCAISRPASPS